MRGLLSRLGARARTLDVEESIVAHLRVLLNTRAGESPATPGFGVLDFNDVVHSFPDGIRKIQQSIRETILAYEPRLKQVSIRHIPSEDPLVLAFDIVGRLESDPHHVLKLRTRLDATGRFAVA